jgi:hypothetical protein
VNPYYYQHLVGELNYLTKTRWDIGFAEFLLSWYMHKPQQLHLNAAFAVLQYLRCHPSLGLWYPKGEHLTMYGFSGGDYASDIDDRISTGAYLFTIGGSPISWQSKKQTVTSRLSYESEGLFTLVTKGRDQSFSCIVIGGKVGAGPSSLYTVKSDQGLQWMKK